MFIHTLDRICGSVCINDYRDTLLLHTNKSSFRTFIHTTFIKIFRKTLQVIIPIPIHGTGIFTYTIMVDLFIWYMQGKYTLRPMESVLRDSGHASLAFDCELLGDPLVDAFLKRQRKNSWQKRYLEGVPKCRVSSS